MPVRTIDTTVSSIESESFTTTAGRPLVRHYVNTADGEKIAVGLKQKYRVGDRINVDVEVKFGKLSEVGPPTGVASASQPAAANKPAVPDVRSPFNRTFPVPELSGEMAIIRQNALTNARELVSKSFSALVPPGATKAERDQYYDAMIEDVLRVAYKFADFTSGHREAKAARQASRLSDKSVSEGA